MAAVAAAIRWPWPLEVGRLGRRDAPDTGGDPGAEQRKIRVIHGRQPSRRDPVSIFTTGVVAT
ncbi:hypothetical protein, partial [Pseudonocardia acaciae]|uniref:hypothetical protein n=1 Tax=Pseudonocardia acaciae TaxID=551276 RepID=UPI001B80B273